jgi:Tol biopolymer transport system component
MKFQTMLLVCGVAAAVLAAQSGNDLFQKGLAKERADGDLPGAIQIYQQIPSMPGVERKLAAEALFRIAECQQALGNAEARKSYLRIVHDFADQREVAGRADDRLKAMEAGSTAHVAGIITRQVWANALDNEGGPSPDGRYLSFVDWTTGDLAVRELVTGKNRRLTKKGPWEQSEEFALFSVFSPDGKQIAYTWFNGAKDQTWDIRIVSIDEPGIPKARVLYHHEDVEDVLPFDWSRDGKQILALFARSDRTHQLGFISVADGSVRVLKTLDWRAPTKMSLSPDGRYVAYDFPPKETASQRDILVLAVDGSRESTVVMHPSNDFAPVWTPDGTRIFFLSDRSGAMGAWMVPVVDGKAQGSPSLIKADVGRMGPMGFTRNGSLFYGLQIGNSDVYVATLDVASARLGEPKSVTEQFSGGNMSPDWSPDGRFLAYVSARGFTREPGSTLVCVRAIETGELRELRPALSYFQSVRWSPDGKTLVAWGSDPKGRRGIFEIDAATGAVSPIIATGDDFRGGMWSPDGQLLYYFDFRSGRLLVRNRQTGRDTELLPPGRFKIERLVLSPDGRQLAMSVGHPEKRTSVIAVMSATGTEPHEILSVPSVPRVFEWMPDSKHLVFSRGHSSDCELWRIASEGGAAERITQRIAMTSMRNLRFHADGRRVAFNAGNGNAEIWVMENFLSALQAKP